MPGALRAIAQSHHDAVANHTEADADGTIPEACIRRLTEAHRPVTSFRCARTSRCPAHALRRAIVVQLRHDTRFDLAKNDGGARSPIPTLQRRLETRALLCISGSRRTAQSRNTDADAFARHDEVLRRSQGHRAFKQRLGPPEPHHPTITPRHQPVNRPVAQPATRAFRPETHPLNTPLPHSDPAATT